MAYWCCLPDRGIPGTVQRSRWGCKSSNARSLRSCGTALLRVWLRRTPRFGSYERRYKASPWLDHRVLEPPWSICSRTLEEICCPAIMAISSDACHSSMTRSTSLVPGPVNPLALGAATRTLSRGCPGDFAAVPQRPAALRVLCGNPSRPATSCAVTSHAGALIWPRSRTGCSRGQWNISRSGAAGCGQRSDEPARMPWLGTSRESSGFCNR
jgi:hypothetical protein